jgi:hypothetical protein
MFLNKFKTGFLMCASESDTQSPAELRVQYPTMPQLLPQPAAAAKNSVLCARRALCFLARFAWRGADAGASSARAEGSKRWSERIEPVACYSSSASQLKSVSYLESPREQRTNEKTRQIAAVFTFFQDFFFLSNRCGSALVTHILTRLLIIKETKVNLLS